MNEFHDSVRILVSLPCSAKSLSMYREAQDRFIREVAPHHSNSFRTIPKHPPRRARLMDATQSPLSGIQVWPVIHLEDEASAFKKAEIAFRNGSPGVFVISMCGRDENIAPVSAKLKQRYPSKLIGVNYLRSPPDVALKTSIEHGFDATWSDNAGVHSEHISEMAKRVEAILKDNPRHLFFGSIAFKYQRPEPRPDLAAKAALSLGMIPCTSGPATGAAAKVEKIRDIRAAIGASAPLALASGVTPANAASFKKYITHILVATGISDQCDNFVEGKLQALIREVSM